MLQYLFFKDLAFKSEMESFINFIENKKRDQIRSENAPEWREKIKVLRERCNKKS